MKTKHIIPIVLVSISVILIIIFRYNPQPAENYYSNTLYPIIASILSFISGVFPFSLSDLFYLLIIIWIFYGLIMLIIKKRTFKWYIINILIGIAYVFSAFQIFWGFNYYRENIFVRMQLPKIEKNRTILYNNILERMVKVANASYSSVDSFPELNFIDKSIEKSYKRNSEFLKINYPFGKRRVKSISLSLVFAKSGILGYFGPFFNEVHVCSKLTKWDIPMVTAHEKAHQFGITSEGEANFYAWLVCAKSTCKWNRYSAALYALSMFVNRAEDKKQVAEITKNLRPEVIDDIKARRDYWRSIRNKKMESVSSFVNDTYLKSNNVKNGVEDYGTMVELIMAYTNKKAIKATKQH